jgi:hypothetical protein
MWDAQLSMESYDGYWNLQGETKDDPPGSKLQQYRYHFGYARRLGQQWQASISIPWVWNDNTYGSQASSSRGLGDTSLQLSYEAFEGVQCVGGVKSWRDLIPASYFQLGLLIPTGISPYDDESNSFDITGRGHYGLDFRYLVEKSIGPWSARGHLEFGHRFERSVNKEYGRPVNPYRRQLGSRFSTSLGFGYSFPTQPWGSITTNMDATFIDEFEESINGQKDANSGYDKKSISLGTVWANVPKTRMMRLSYTFSPRQSNWGKNFPITQTITWGFSYVTP